MKKGCSSNSFPKTFSSVFSARGTPTYGKTELFFYYSEYPLRKKQNLKSWERGSGKNLSSERFAPIKSMNFHISTAVTKSAAFLSVKSAETLLEVVDDVINIFKTYRKTYHTAVDTAGNKLLVSELTVCSTCRMKYAGTDISNMNFI